MEFYVMKILLLGISMLMLSYSSFASTFNDSRRSVVSFINENNDLTSITIELKQQGDNKSTLLNFTSVEELEEFDFATLNFAIEECTVTATVTVSVKVSAGIGVVGGEVTTSVSASITASCETIGAAVKKLANVLKASIT